MSKWKTKLKIAEEFQQAKRGEITGQALAGLIAQKLEKLRSFSDSYIEEEKDSIVDEFKEFSEEGGENGEFDYIFEKLYDWADISLDGKFGGEKVCWIETC